MIHDQRLIICIGKIWCYLSMKNLFINCHFKFRPPQPQGSIYGLPPHTRLPPYHGPGPFHHPGHPGNPNVRPGMQEYQSNYY